MFLTNLKYKQKVLFILTLVFTVVAIGLVILYMAFYKDLLEHHGKDIRNSSNLTEVLINRKASDMGNLVTFFQTNRPLIEYLYITTVIGADKEPLKSMVMPMLSSLGIDALNLYDRKGKNVLGLGPEECVAHKSKHDRKAGKIVYGFEASPGWVHITAMGPLQYTGNIIGYISICKKIDAKFLSELMDISGSEQLFVKGNTVVASSFNKNRFPYQPAEAKLRFKGLTYSIVEREINDLDGKPVGAMVTAISDKSLSDSLFKLRLYMLGMLAASAAISFGLGMLLIKALVNPLGEMVSFVEKVGRGQFDQYLKKEGKDEIAILSRQFDNMLTELKTHRDAVERYTSDLESAVEARTNELEKVQRQLMQSQKMESLGTLAGGIAHDFNNLLSAILGYASFAKEQIEQDHSQYRYWDIVEQAAMRAAELTSQLLTFSRGSIEPGKEEPVNVNRLIDELTRLLANTFDKSVIIERKLSKEEPYVIGNKTALYQAFLNICINAKDAMPDGGRLVIEALRFQTDDIFLSSHPGSIPGGYVQINISDTGAGIKKEIIDRIFEPFFTTKESGKGTGLGLAIVYGVIHENKGFINVYSEHGSGTTFKIYLPAGKEDKDAEMEEPTKFYAGKGQTVLVVDDEQPLRELCREILEKANYRVITASDGMEAVRIFEENKDSISLIVLDLIMPGMSGHETFRKLKGIKPPVKVIISSGYSPEISLKWAEEKVDAFIQKPFRSEDLLKKIKEILD